MLRLNNTSLKPLYMQLKELLKEDIRNGKYKLGEQLPSEAELCDIYQVSRITTRRAIQDLVEEGVLKRQQGKGTFVTEAKLKRELISVHGATKLTESMGRSPKTQILSYEVMKASEEIAAPLSIPMDDPVLKLHRIHFVDDVPLNIETVCYPLRRFPNLGDYILENKSTYSILKERYQVEPKYHQKKLNVIMASKEEAELLNISQGEPLYELDSLVTCENHIPIHTSLALLPVNKVTFTINY